MKVRATPYIWAATLFGAACTIPEQDRPRQPEIVIPRPASDQIGLPERLPADSRGNPAPSGAGTLAAKPLAAQNEEPECYFVIPGGSAVYLSRLYAVLEAGRRGFGENDVEMSCYHLAQSPLP